MRVETSKRDKYLEELLCTETEKMRMARQKAAEFGKTGMHLSAVEGQMLAWFVSLTSAQQVLEIGSFTGYSALWMLSAMPASGCLTVIESDPVYQQVLEQTLDDSRVEVKKGDAREIIEKLESKFDVVFIDANKAAYVDYLDWAMQKMNPGGLIIGDNTFLFDGVFQEARIDVSKKQIAVMREFNDKLASNPKFKTTILPTFEGMTVGRFLG